MESTLINVLVPAVSAFTIGIFITPIITHYLYAHKAWKKQGGKIALNGDAAAVFNELKGVHETKTPRMGGIVIWVSVLSTLFGTYFVALLFPDTVLAELDFMSRSQTYIPAVSLLVGAMIGFLNDFYDITHGGKGLRLSVRLLLVTLLSGALGWWFYTKLGVTAVNLPFGHAWELGIFIIPFYIFLTISVYASGIIDGIDGL